MLVPIAAAVLVLGIYPKPVLERIEPSVDRLITRIEATTDYRVPDFGFDPVELGAEGGEG